ncbi:MAG: hypothetical protein ABI832_17665, partial [bacterium]
MTQIVTTDSLTAFTQYNLTSFQSLLLAEGVTIATTSGLGILGDGSSITLIINGNIIAAGDGIDIGDQVNSGNDVIIGRTGSVLADGIGGVVIYNAATNLTNLGTISGTYAGVWLSTNTGDAVVMVNDGTIV